VQVANPPLALIFGPFDPSGSSSLPADTVTCARLGCHALGTVTGLQVRDTAVVESIQPVPPEVIDDQARCVLEDMTVQAIKVGAVYTAEAVSVLAQIAADYNQVPLVLHLGRLPDESLLEHGDTEDLQLALFELLLPQANLVVIDYLLLEQWQSQGLLPGGSAEAAIQALLEYGADWVLTTGMPLRPGQGSYLLQGQRNETAHFPWQAPSSRLMDADGPLTCAITVELARGRAIPEAVEAAIAQAEPFTAHHFQPGMGQRIINRCQP